MVTAIVTRAVAPNRLFCFTVKSGWFLFQLFGLGVGSSPYGGKSYDMNNNIMLSKPIVLMLF
jgi:hypothetical protein